MTVINKTTLESELQALVDALTVSSTDTDLLSLAAAIAELGSGQENHVPTSADLPVTTPPGSVYFVMDLGIPVVSDGTGQWFGLDGRGLILDATALWTWGQANYGQLGNDTTTPDVSSPSSIIIDYPSWTQVTAGKYHHCAIKQDGSMWCWGQNGKGTLGSNAATNGSELSPVSVLGSGPAWTQVSGSQGNTMGLKANGTLWVWGINYNGQLGNGNHGAGNFKKSPVQEMSYSTDWALVSSGGYYSGGIKKDGSLWTWGKATSGRLGHNSFFADRSSPGTISGAGTTWQKLSCGEDFGAAIKTDGTLWTWGGNLYGQLGDGTGTSRSSPETVAGGGTTWDQVAVGRGGLSGIKTDGTLWVWGYNLTGRVGDGTTTSRSSPVTTAGGGTNWAKIANSWGTSNHAIKTDGTLWTWGTNSDGELGTGNATSRSSPGTAIGNLLWTSVAGATSSRIGLSDPDTTYSDGYP